MDVARFFAELPLELVMAVVTTSLFSLVAVSVKPIRQALFYTRHEFEFEYQDGWGSCDWDIQWENFRLTLEVDRVHNEHIEQLVIKKDGANPGEKFTNVGVGDDFRQVPGWALQFKY